MTYVLYDAPAGTRHGSAWTYKRYGCRCPRCTAANSEAARQRHAKLRQRTIPPRVVHGRYTTYNNWRCRCEPCRKAYTAYRRAERKRQKAVAP